MFLFRIFLRHSATLAGHAGNSVDHSHVSVGRCLMLVKHVALSTRYGSVMRAYWVPSSEPLVAGALLCL